MKTCPALRIHMVERRVVARFRVLCVLLRRVICAPGDDGNAGVLALKAWRIRQGGRRRISDGSFGNLCRDGQASATCAGLSYQVRAGPASIPI